MLPESFPLPTSPPLLCLQERKKKSEGGFRFFKSCPLFLPSPCALLFSLSRLTETPQPRNALSNGRVGLPEGARAAADALPFGISFCVVVVVVVFFFFFLLLIRRRASPRGAEAALRLRAHRGPRERVPCAVRGRGRRRRWREEARPGASCSGSAAEANAAARCR